MNTDVFSHWFACMFLYVFAISAYVAAATVLVFCDDRTYETYYRAWVVIGFWFATAGLKAYQSDKP